MNVLAMYFTGNQKTTCDELNTKRNAYEIIAELGQRLRRAMGEKEVLSRSTFVGGEFRVPTFRAYAECLDRNPWTACAETWETLRVVPYSSLHEGWSKQTDRHGFMATAFNPHEYSYEFWDNCTHRFHPDLLDSGTFGTWLELLPQPVSVILDCENTAMIRWSANEPRVHRSMEMGRYCLSSDHCSVSVTAKSWRLARAEAYVRAWEKMALNEPPDRYESVMLAEQESF